VTRATRITSAASDRVKAVRALHSRAGRRKAGVFLVEGPQAVASALDAGVVIRDLFADDDAGVVVSELSDRAEAAGVRVTPVSSAVLAAMAETEQPQGVLAVCELLPSPAVADLAVLDGPLVVLDALSDPGNVGTVIRTAAAVGAAGVILSPGTADPHNGKVVRSTAGSIFHIPVARGVDVAEAAGAARDAGRRVAVATGDADVDLFAAVSQGDVDARTCWILGSEAHGVSPEALAAADIAVRIPMAEGPESLNAAVAGAVVLYVTAYDAARSPSDD
jgi:TrmH family RNA methyltransferase